jgi:hypothetical protein
LTGSNSVFGQNGLDVFDCRGQVFYSHGTIQAAHQFTAVEPTLCGPFQGGSPDMRGQGKPNFTASFATKSIGETGWNDPAKVIPAGTAVKMAIRQKRHPLVGTGV